MHKTVVSLLLAASMTATPAVAHAGGNTQAAASVTGTIDRPHTTGRWFTDSTGRVVTFHGENIVNKVAPYVPHVSDDDAQFLAAQGTNAIRLGLNWSAVEPQPGVYNDAYLAEIKKTIDMFAAHGISTFVEYHQDIYTTSLGGEGAPEWATFTDGQFNPNLGLAVAQFSPAVQRAFDNFFNNRPAADGIGIRDHYVAMWEHTAAYLKDTAGIIGYGPINEPSAGAETIPCALDFCSEATLEKLRELNKQVAGVIRKHDAHAGIWITGYVTTVMGAPAHMGEKVDPNSAYAYNSYAQVCTVVPFDFPEAACEPDHRKAMNQSWDYANANAMPAIMAEFGASNNPNVLRNQSKLSDETMQSRFHWQYGGYDPTTTARSWQTQALVIDPTQPITGTNVNWSNVQALSTPYPSAVAGTPTGWSSASGTFTASWNSARADGKGSFPAGSLTAIKVPQIWAPNGYRVSITGGQALDIPTDGIFRDTNLVISSTADAPVTLTVTPL